MLVKNRTITAFEKAEQKIKKHLTPSDWFIIGFFSVLTIFGIGTMLAQTSLRLSVEVPVHAGTHIEGVIGTPRFINPLLTTSEIDNDLTALVFGGLTKIKSDGTVAPYLAERYEISEDALEYTFYLKDAIFFDDGTPITAEDVVYTVQATKDPTIKSPRRANWEGVEVIAIDEKTVVFTLRTPYALFLENTTLGIMPKHLWSEVSMDEFPFSELNTKPVGSGLYRVLSIKKNPSGVPAEYMLRASKNSTVRPFIKNMGFKFFSNQEALENALLSGDIDAAHSLPPPPSDKISSEEAIFSRVFGVFFNQNQQELFADEAIRRALDRVIDKQKIVDTVVSGYGSVLDGPLPPDRVGPKTPLSPKDFEERVLSAQVLLEKNGWEKGEDGVFQKTTKKQTQRLQFSLATANAPELKQSAELVAEMWRSFGADVTLQFFDHNDLNVEVIRPRKYDALLFGLVVGRELDLFAFWHSSQRNDPGLNIALYANIRADKYLEEARNELDPKKRKEKAKRAAKEIVNETAAVFLYAPHFTYIHEPELRGVSLQTVSVPSNRFAGVEEWYVMTERVWPLFIRN